MGKFLVKKSVKYALSTTVSKIHIQAVRTESGVEN